MYADFFGLRELPFNNTPDPRYFFSTPDHEEAMASLIYAVNERKGFVLLTGEVGAGKTLVSRMMLRHFGARIAFANINHATVGPQDLMESVLDEFEIARPPGAGNAQLVRLLHDFLLAQFAANTPVVLVLDEAQSLSVPAFEQLRMIGNLEADDAKLLQICILGQPELRTLFASTPLRQLRQRLFRSFHLGRMTRDLTAGYIHHRLTIAGASDLDLFEPAAIDAIHVHAQGIPRLINALCDNAMLSAYSASQRTISAAAVEGVIAQMMTIHAAPEEPAQLPAAPRPTAPAHQLLRRRTVADAVPALEATAVQPKVPAPAPAAAKITAPPPVDADTGIQSLTARLSRLEQSLVTLSKDPGRLDSLLHRTTEAVKRGETVNGDLAQREARAEKMHSAFQAMITESRRLMERMGRLSDGNDRAERQVRELYEGLSVQSQRTVRLASVLRQVLDRIEHRAGTLAAQVNEAPPSSAAAGTVVTPSGERLPLRTNPSRIERLLDSSRESLSDLRSLLIEAGPSSEDAARAELRPVRPETEPAERLADSVQSLLKYMEGGDVAVA